MIAIYLSIRALSAARAVDPNVSPAAVHAAIEVALAEELRRMVRCSPEEIEARAMQLAPGGR
jgi:hypothetical protein